MTLLCTIKSAIHWKRGKTMKMKIETRTIIEIEILNWNKNFHKNWGSMVVLGFNCGFVVQFFPGTKCTQICVERAFQLWFWFSIWFLWFSWNQTTEIRIPLSSIVNNPYNFSHEFSSFLIQQALEITVVITRYATLESNERNLSGELDDVQENNKIAWWETN
jgi:hypothetical protein